MIGGDRSHAQGGKRLYKPEPVSHRKLLSSLARRERKGKHPLSRARRMMRFRWRKRHVVLTSIK